MDDEYERYEIGLACCKCRKITLREKIYGYFYTFQASEVLQECNNCGHTRCEIPDRE